MTVWQQWLRQPQSVRLRKAQFQVHLWTGLALGLYVVVICLAGSVLVYRNELYQTFSPEPVVVEVSGSPLSADALSDAARRVYPGYTVSNVRPGQAANHAVEITLVRGEDARARLFDPFTGRDLESP
jgi:uncharacterized iron-regulated membrane protein